MSEFKGQLLGMVLVIAIFAVVAVSLKGMFTSEVTEISNRLSTALSGI